jgi:peptidoglycan hydrolase CwlO-like protein
MYSKIHASIKPLRKKVERLEAEAAKLAKQLETVQATVKQLKLSIKRLKKKC